METFQQCLLFILIENGPGGTDRPSAFSETEPSTETLILLPRPYLREHPDVLRIFRQNNILVLDEENVSRCIFDGGKSLNMEIMEIFLDDPPVSESPLAIPDYSSRFYLLIKHSFPCMNTLRFHNSFGGSRPAVDDENVSLIKYLLAHNPKTPINIRFDWDCLGLGYYSIDLGSFLHLAVSRGHLPFARTLLALGLDVNGLTKKSFSPLQVALRMELTTMVQLLVEDGADLSYIDPMMGRTPLSMCYDFEVTEILLQNGADPNEGYKRRGKTPEYNFLRCCDNNGPLQAMLNYGARVDSLIVQSSPPFASVLESALLGDVSPRVFQYLLERCYVNYNLLMRALSAKIIHYVTFVLCLSHKNSLKVKFNTFAGHVYKIAAIEDRISADFCPRLSEINSNLGEFANECKAELAQLRCQKLGDTGISYFELLSKNEFELAHLLGSECVCGVADFGDLLTRFPVYGTILSILIENGKLRKSIQAKGIRNMNILSSHFRKLPDELKETIVSFLNMLDVTRLEKASVRPQALPDAESVTDSIACK